jgi:hypothetical protein
VSLKKLKSKNLESMAFAEYIENSIPPRTRRTG